MARGYFNSRCLRLATLMVVNTVASTLPANERLPPNLSVAEAIDYDISARLDKEGISPAPPADDSTLVRRLVLDLAGRIPIADEAQSYVESQDAEKRQKLIQRLIASPDFVRHSAAEFEVLLKGYSEQSPSVHAYLLTAFQENRTWDNMFQHLMGESPDQPTAVNFVLGRLSDQDALVRDVSSIFLGMNIECARCHDHPYVDGISQEYYYGMRSFFSRCHDFQGQLHERQFGVLQFRPLDGEERAARLIFLTGQVVEENLPTSDEQQKMIDEENKQLGALNETFKEKKVFPPRPAFSRKAKFVEAALGAETRQRMAASIVNRLWYRFFGHGLVMPVDQIHAQNPASHPELLNWLARDLMDHGFDLRRTTQGIVSSQTYARSSRWSDAIPPAANLFAVARVRPLSPLQYSRSLRLVSDLPDWPAEQTSEQYAQRVEQLETVSREHYEKHLRPLKPGDQVGITEVLKFSNDEGILNSLGENLITSLAKKNERRDQILTASWVIYSRAPSAEEVVAIEELLNTPPEDPESVKWALQQRDEIQNARSRVATIEQDIQQIELTARQQAQRRVLARTSDYLAAVAQRTHSKVDADFQKFAAAHDLKPEILQRWYRLTEANLTELANLRLLDSKLDAINGNKLLLGWGSDTTPWLGVNSHDQPATAGFVVPPHALAMHPAPEQQIALGWQSPLLGRVRISFRVSAGHPEGSNGVDWTLVHRHPLGETRLSEGFVKQGESFPDEETPTIVTERDVRPGEFVLLVIAAHEHQHACDTTICDLTITEIEEQHRTWKAVEQLQNRIHLGNPLADTLGNPSVWHFYTRSDDNKTAAVALISPASPLGQWIDMLHGKNDSKALIQLAISTQQRLLTEADSPVDASAVDQKLCVNRHSSASSLFADIKLDSPLDEKAKSEIAALAAALDVVRPVAAKPLPIGIEERQQKSLRQLVWAMLMSPEFRFNH